MPQRIRFLWQEYLLRFMAAWGLALLIWILAISQTNPISVRAFNNIPVQYEVDEGFSLINTPANGVRVLVRAQQSTLNLLTAEDVIVRADFRGRAAGPHTIPLQVSINRPGALGDSQPTQISASLQALVTQQKPIEVVGLNDVPTDYDYDPIQASILQARVSGPSDRVAQVAAVRGEVELRDRRAPFEATIVLAALDSEGRRVSDVRIEPESLTVRVNVVARDDVRQVAVRPNILLQTLARGYVLSSLDYSPQFVYLSGSPSVLASLGATVETTPINLQGRLASYDTNVGLVLPEDILILGETNTISVSIGIGAQIATRQLDNIAVTLIGLGRELQATPALDRISVVISGPSSILDGLDAADLSAVIDLANVGVGSHEIIPRLDLPADEIGLSNITLLPPFITVTVTEQAEVTPERSP